jgi:hypothetical protein
LQVEPHSIDRIVVEFIVTNEGCHG